MLFTRLVGPGHIPFKAATGVRIPVGVQTYAQSVGKVQTQLTHHSSVVSGFFARIQLLMCG